MSDANQFIEAGKSALSECLRNDADAFYQYLGAALRMRTPRFLDLFRFRLVHVFLLTAVYSVAVFLVGNLSGKLTEPRFDKAVAQIEELGKWGHKDFPELHELAVEIRSKVRRRKYDDAITMFERLLTTLAPIHETYRRQRDARDIYLPRWKSLQPEVDATIAAIAPTDELRTLQQQLKETREAMERSASKKDYVAANASLTQLAAQLPSRHLPTLAPRKGSRNRSGP